LTGTFYGVDPQFATQTRAAYRASAGLIATRVLTSLSYRITRYLSITGFARYDSVAGAANRSSPLVERSGGLTYGLNMSWTIGESSERAFK
jgi:outer membrane scaffolding protein for murein synthesis (MipA/OmpV family)